MVLHRELLVNGVFLGGPCDYATGKDVIVSPWNGSVVGTVAEAGWPEAEAAVAAASDAFALWSRTPRTARQTLLRTLAQLVRERAEELADLLVAEVGKPITFARSEVERMAFTFEASARLLDEPEFTDVDLGPDPRASRYRAQSARFPIGPILAIVPYNWPYNLAAHKIGPALAAGNTVVLKVSPWAPLCGLTLARLIHEAGCPPGVVNALHMSTAHSERLVQDDRWAMVSFTGSPSVGFAIRATSPARRVTLELGGDAFVLIEPGTDLDLAIPALTTSAFGFAGQVCISAQHVWVRDEMTEEVRERLIEATSNCPTGDPKLKETVCGPLISAEAADRVESWIDEAVAAGAHALIRGERTRNLLRPSLIENVPESVRLGCDEVFGPVLTLGSYSDLSDAFARVRRSPFALQASLFSRDSDAVEEAFREVPMGTWVINDVPSVRFDSMPYGGLKRSGLGREGVRFAFEEMTEIRLKLERAE